MILIITFIALLVERYGGGSLARLRHLAWFSAYQALFDRYLSKYTFWRLGVRPVVYLLPILLLVALVHVWLQAFSQTASVLFSLIALWYCLGPENLYTQLSMCFYKSADAQQEPIDTKNMNLAFGLSLHHDDANARLIFCDTALSLANQRLAATLLWFIVLGPVGAFLYRLLAQYAQQSVDPAAVYVQHMLEWIPARLLGMSYALTGSFIHVMPVWFAGFLAKPEHNHRLLVACARAAFNINDKEQYDVSVKPSQVVALLDRSFVLWLVVIALVTVQ